MEAYVKPRKRFSLLLLEDGEHYLQDWIVTCRNGASKGSKKNSAFDMSWQTPQRGRLRLCSKSCYFEPYELQLPILRFPLNKVIRIDPLSESAPSLTERKTWSSNIQEGFILETTLIVKLKTNGVDMPYVFEKTESIWSFLMDYAPARQFLQQIELLVPINILPNPERDLILRNAAAQREAQAEFDISRLTDLREGILINCIASQITPLVKEPGRFLLSVKRIYFQPLHNLNHDSPVRSQPINTVIAVAKRRSSMRNIGLELFFSPNTIGKGTGTFGLDDRGSIFFTFTSVTERNAVLAVLLEQLEVVTGSAIGSLIDADGSWLDRVTAAWQAGCVSNFDYLMYLNLVAGRSFCDLSQWPVMPWVLSNYESDKFDLDDPSSFRDLSKPVGALNPSRLVFFQERYKQMPRKSGSELPFLYGTHYSAPGYVLYWLVRAAPGHMLRLQNGRFDTPDRLFVSVINSWKSVLNNPADVKELIPEFYSLPSDFLVTRGDINLGTNQNGIPIGDVCLPSWSSNPNDFIMKNRQALECAYVSEHLHLWIDLIFGFKQRGEMALAANNLFHHLTYDGSIDLEKIEDPFQRMGLESQINEFGQCPQQLFTGPHPAKSSDSQALAGIAARIPNDILKSSCAEILARIMHFTESAEHGSGNIQFSEVSTPQDVPIEHESFIESPGKVTCEPHSESKSLSFDNSLEEDISHLGDSEGGGMPQNVSVETDANDNFDSYLTLTTEGAESSSRKQSWPWKLNAKVSGGETLRLHRGPVNAIFLSEENASGCLTVYSAGEDGFIKVHSISEGFTVRSTKLGNLPLSSLALVPGSDAYPVVLAGSYDNCVYAYSVDYGRSLGKVRVHDDAVSCLRFNANTSKMVTASWDGTVKIWNVDEGRGGWSGGNGWASTGNRGKCMEFMEHDAAISCLEIEEKGNIIFFGADDGCIAWDARASASPIWKSKELRGCSGLSISSEGSHLVATCLSGFLQVLETRKGEVLSSVDCKSPLKCCEIANGIAVAGSASGGVYFWSLESACFEMENIDLFEENGQRSEINDLSICSGITDEVNIVLAFKDSSIQVLKSES